MVSLQRNYEQNIAGVMPASDAAKYNTMQVMAKETAQEEDDKKRMTNAEIVLSSSSCNIIWIMDQYVLFHELYGLN